MASVAVRARFSGSKPVLRTQRAASVRMEAKNGLFYSTSSGKTQDIAELIKEKLGDSVEGPFEPDEASMGDYDNLIVGSPTWNTGADTDRSGTDWDQVGSDEIGDCKGKTVAVFGLGDSTSCAPTHFPVLRIIRNSYSLDLRRNIEYGDYFCDAMGELHDKFESAGAKMVGYVGTDGYEYDESKSVKGSQFVGLPLDEDNEDDKTEPRVDAWLAQLKGEMAM